QTTPGTFTISGALTGGQNLVFNPTTIAAGASFAVTVTGTVSANDANASFTGSLVNTATMTAANETTAEQNQSATATINITAPHITISKITTTPLVNSPSPISFTI